MSRFDESYEGGKKAAKDASGGIFAELRDDGDRLVFAFQQDFLTKEEMTDWGSKNRSAANIAVFSEDGTTFESMQILKLAPTHAVKLIERRIKFGGDKLYEIIRRGAARSTDTYYECDVLRPLTTEEMTLLDSKPLHDLTKVRDEDNGYPAAGKPEATDSTASATEHKASPFMKQCGAEAVRLGWAPDVDTLKSNIARANKYFFKGFIASKDMTHDEQQRFLEGLKAMQPGQGPDAIVDVTVDKLDLDEDINFF